MASIAECTQCPKQCPIDELQCGKGRVYFEEMKNGGVNMEGNNDRSDRHGFCGGHENRRGKGGCGGPGNHHGHGGHGGHGGCEEHKGQGLHRRGRGNHGFCKDFEQSDDLSGLIRSSGHYLRHQGGRGSGQGRILHILSKCEEINQKELQHILQVQPGSLSEILTKLENKGFVERIRDDEDKRKTIVKVTEAGKAHVDNCGCQKNNTDMFSALDEKQQEELKILLKILLEDWKKNREE